MSVELKSKTLVLILFNLTLWKSSVWVFLFFFSDGALKNSWKSVNILMEILCSAEAGFPARKSKENHDDRKTPISPKQLPACLQKSGPVIDSSMCRNEQPRVWPFSLFMFFIYFLSGLKLFVSSCLWYNKFTIMRVPAPLLWCPWWVLIPAACLW